MTAATMDKRMGLTLWLTGLPCSGKTTIAILLKHALEARGHPVELLDGDELRRWSEADAGFSREERTRYLRRVAHLCHLLTKHGVMVVAAFVAPYREVREDVRQRLGSRLIEIYIDTPLDECIRRDVKGMYKQALAGTITHFTGVSDAYEPPTNPHMTIQTLGESPQESAQKILDALPEFVRRRR